MLASTAVLLAMAWPVELPVVGSSANAELTLRGQYTVQPGWGDGFLAMIHLSLPLARLASLGGPSAPDRKKEAARPPDAPPRDPATSGEAQSEASPPAGTGSASSGPSSEAQASGSAGRAQPTPKASERSVAPVLTPKLARETVLRALEHAGLSRDKARVASMVSRARYSALLPDLRLRAARRTDETLRLTPTLDDPYRYTLAGGSDLLFEASLTWRFDQLLFGAPEVSAERLLAQRAERMQALARQVLDELFDWQRARLALGDPGALPEERERAALEELEARTRLFVMTGGWFGTTPAFKAP